MEIDTDLLADGIKRLHDLLPDAKMMMERHREGIDILAVPVDKEEPLFRYMLEENLLALVIISKNDGFYGYVLLKEVTPGLADGFSLPGLFPCETIFEALDASRRLLAISLLAYNPDVAASLSFTLDNCKIKIMPEIMQAICEGEQYAKLKENMLAKRDQFARVFRVTIYNFLKELDIPTPVTSQAMIEAKKRGGPAYRHFMMTIYTAASIGMVGWSIEDMELIDMVLAGRHLRQMKEELTM